MAKKSKQAKGRSQKWSRANVMNYVLGGVVALSMVLGSIFMFGGTAPQGNAAQPTPTAAIMTLAPGVSQGATLTPSTAATPTP